MKFNVNLTIKDALDGWPELLALLQALNSIEVKWASESVWGLCD